jgi:dihydroflavonol-4-reductase
MSKVLVTGATGFVGTHLVRALVASGTQVCALKRPTSDVRILQDLECEWVYGSLEDQSSLDMATAGCEVVFHCAGLASFWSRERRALHKVNVVGTRNLLAACVKNGTDRVVITNSTAALGIPTSGTIGDEETTWNWQSHGIDYFETKYLQLQETRHFVKGGLPIVTVMPGLIVGDGDRTGCASRTRSLIKAMRAGQVRGYASGGTTVVSVADVAQGHLLAAEQGKPGQHYVLGGDHLSFREIFNQLAGYVGIEIPAVPLTERALLRLGALFELKGRMTRTEPVFTRELVHILSQCCYYSSAKAERELGYLPSDPRSAIRRAYDWYSHMDQQGVKHVECVA